MLNILEKFNYRFMSMTRSINPYTVQHLRYATDKDLTHEGKMDLIAKTKISICYNNFPIGDSRDAKNVTSRLDWYKNSAFSEVDKLGIIPQLKSRFIEAAVSKTLNLVERDPWNVIEEWYESGKHFVYFDSNEELEDKISDILNNWDDYATIIDNAYDLSVNHYMCDSLVERICNQI